MPSTRNGDPAVVCMLAGFLLMALAWGAVAEATEVHLSEPDWPPYFFGEASGSPPGLAKELLAICFDEAGVEPRYRRLPTERMHSYIRSGELDINIFSYREDREDFLFYGKEALFSDTYRPVARSDSELEIREISDFDGLKLGHIHGLRYSRAFMEYVDRREVAGGLTVVPNTEVALDMLAAGRIDVFVSTEKNVRYLLRQTKTIGIEIVDYEVRAGDYFVTVSKKSRRVRDPEAFLATVDACLAGLKADGRYAEIENRYR